MQHRAAVSNSKACKAEQAHKDTGRRPHTVDSYAPQMTVWTASSSKAYGCRAQDNEDDFNLWMRMLARALVAASQTLEPLLPWLASEVDRDGIRATMVVMDPAPVLNQAADPAQA